MKRRVVVFSLLAVLCSVALAEGKKRNVLFIAVDDLRPELACYGHPVVKSPNIDRLASEGVLFDRAYCQFALCNPTRSSLLTGRRPETLGIYDLKTFVRTPDPKVVTLPELFKNHGYQALSFGKIFHNSNGNHDDPDSWSAPPWHYDPLTSGVKIKPNMVDPDAPDHSGELPYAAPDCADDELIDGQIARKTIAAMRLVKDKPFFLAAGFHRPHLPFVAPKKYWDLYDPSKIALAPNSFLPKDAPAFASNDASELRRYLGVPKKGPISAEESRRLIHGYYASVSYVDAQVGLLMDELERLGLRENTIVILWGDHGYHLGEHGTWNKRTNWEVATRVPLIVSFPGQKARGAKSEALVEFVDVYPTLADLCGLPLPGKLEGISMAPLLDTPGRSWKKAAFSINQKKIPGLGNGFGRAMRTDRYRFIEWCGDESSKTICELYDHQVDPQENTNVASAPENRALVEDLTKQLRAGWKAALP